jgi:hypothetical protein
MWLAAVLAASSVVPATSAQGNPAQPLQVISSNPGAFEVIYHRATPPGIGAVVGGIIGAAIQQGAQSSEDDAMAKQVLASNPDLGCDQPLVTALKAKLQSSGRYLVEDSGNGSMVVDVDIRDCGLHLADSKALELSSYVSLKLKVQQPGGKPWTEQIQISGYNRYSFEQFTHQQGLATTELMDALKRAGVRAADKIIYKQLGTS